MTCEGESRNAHNAHCFIEQLSRLEPTDALTEVSIAALTTEPELMNIGRSLISLARYHALRKAQPVMSRRYR
jgi:hypothetical protein